MRLAILMEENRDTAGWGIIATVWVVSNTPPTLLQQLGTAALIAGCGWLGSYIIKKIVTNLESWFKRWRENRKKTNNPN